MGSIDTGTYRAILRVKQARLFDLGTLLMRLFAYTTTIGTITMLTLAGASALEATSVSSFLAICTFVVSPRVSKRIDERGQGAIVPKATAIGISGFAIMLATTHFGGPFWLNYPAVALASFLPNAQALVRTRWTYLIFTGKLGDDAPSLKTAYAFEGILEDLAFMVGPASVIAISAALFPTAGLFVGCIIFCVGAAMLVKSGDTEPEPGWGRSASGDDKKKSVFRTNGVVRLLFFVMVLVGCMYGAFDAAAVSYAESIDFTFLASVVFAVESLFSVGMSVLFGMIGFASPLRKQFVVFAVLFGAAYASVVFVSSPVTLIVIGCVAGLTYAPFLITSNVVCERVSPDDRLTESMAWMNSGMSVGLVIGPVSSGAAIDSLGPLYGFDICALYAVCIVALVLAFTPMLRKHM